MVKRNKFASRDDDGKKRGAIEVKIDDMQLLKSAHSHDKLRIASLKRKLDRVTRKKYEMRGQNFSDDEDVLGSNEDLSCVTEAPCHSVRNALKKPRKQSRFKDQE